MQKEYNKVFCIGWHKTGTTTLGEALLMLGFNVVGARLDLADPLMNGDVGLLMKEAEKYKAFQDVPWAALFRELDQEYPGSKFILTVRDENKWLNSASNHFEDKYYKLHEWLYGVGKLRGNEDIYLKRYRKHYKEVDEYFKDRPDDLLVIDWSKEVGWKHLCQFLNKPIPAKSFPYANKGKHNYSFWEKVYDRLRGILPVNVRRKVLDVLGFADKRNRFHNYEENTSRITKK